MKRIRDIKKLVLNAGLEVAQVRITGGCHVRADTTNQVGLRRFFLFSLTPGDSRADLNNTSLMRRFAAATELPVRRP